MNPNRLFFRRLIAGWAFQFRVWKMAVDWTVALYFIAPAVGFGIYSYVSLWRETPAWADLIPAWTWLALLYIITGLGGIRQFVEEADVLFLLRKPHWIQRLRRFGLIYSVILKAGAVASGIIIAAPFLNARGLGAADLAGIGILAVLAGTANGLAQRLIALRYRTWRRWAAQVLSFAAIGAIFIKSAEPGAAMEVAFGAGALFAVFTVHLARIRLNLTGTFYADAAYEQERKMAFASILLAAAVPKPSRLLRRKRAWLFPNSGTWLKPRTPQHVVAETIVKSFFRNGNRLNHYVQFTVLCCFALLLLPAAVKWFFYLTVSLVMAYWAKMHAKEVYSSSFIKLLPLSETLRVQAVRKATPYLFLPGFAFTGFVLGISAYSIWAGLLMLPAGYVLGYAAAAVVNAFG
jgi:predicted ABC-type exoprotein transport system permease subunit